jgi:hypothetical protein
LEEEKLNLEGSLDFMSCPARRFFRSGSAYGGLQRLTKAGRGNINLKDVEKHQVTKGLRPHMQIRIIFQGSRIEKQCWQ